MKFIGNIKAVEFLKKSIENGKLNHAYIFSGPENLGKFALAKNFSESIIEGKPLDLEIGNKDKIPLDLVILEPEIEKKKGVVKEKEIKIESIRDIQKDLNLFPFEGKYKILIVNHAHKMNASSQNALLKILEEPNKTTIIILVTSEDSKILPTIKSRCQKINFFLVDNEEIKKAFKKNDEAVLFSMGRPGLICEFSENPKELEERKKDFDELKNLFQMETNERLKMAEKFSGDLVRTLRKLEFWIWILRDADLYRTDTDFIRTKTKNYNNYKLIEKIGESIEKLKKTNANSRLVLENLLINL